MLDAYQKITNTSNAQTRLTAASAQKLYRAYMRLLERVSFKTIIGYDGVIDNVIEGNLHYRFWQSFVGAGVGLQRKVSMRKE